MGFWVGAQWRLIMPFTDYLHLDRQKTATTTNSKIRLGTKYHYKIMSLNINEPNIVYLYPAASQNNISRRISSQTCRNSQSISLVIHELYPIDLSVYIHDNFLIYFQWKFPLVIWNSSGSVFRWLSQTLSSVKIVLTHVNDIHTWYWQTLSNLRLIR